MPNPDSKNIRDLILALAILFGCALLFLAFLMMKVSNEPRSLFEIEESGETAAYSHCEIVQWEVNPLEDKDAFQIVMGVSCQRDADLQVSVTAAQTGADESGLIVTQLAATPNSALEWRLELELPARELPNGESKVCLWIRQKGYAVVVSDCETVTVPIS